MIEGFIGALLGGLISGLIHWLLYKRKESEEVRKRHFEELKQKCIKPLIEELSKLKESFDISENTSFDYYLEASQRDIKWWDCYSLKQRVEDELLYEDLRNHFKDLYNELEHIEKHIVKELYPKYVKLMGELVLVVRNEIAKELSKLPSKISDKEALTAIIMMVLGKGKGDWPNIYMKLKKYGLLDRLQLIASRISEHERALELLKTREDALSKLNQAKRHLLEILHLQKLRGKCPYCRS